MIVNWAEQALLELLQMKEKLTERYKTLSEKTKPRKRLEAELDYNLLLKNEDKIIELRQKLKELEKPQAELNIIHGMLREMKIKMEKLYQHANVSHKRNHTTTNLSEEEISSLLVAPARANFVFDNEQLQKFEHQVCRKQLSAEEEFFASIEQEAAAEEPAYDLSILPPKQREAVLLISNGLSFSKAADYMHVTRSTVSRQFYRAKKKLQEGIQLELFTSESEGDKE